MSRWLKWSIISVISVLLLIILLWLGLAAYVQFNKKSILENVTAQLNDNLNGKLTIEDMDPTLLRGFPGVAISLKNVNLRDSLWKLHHKDLLSAETIYVAVDAFSLIKGKPKIKDINISNAKIYLYVDSTGYSNADIFKLKETPDTTSNTQKTQPKINHLTLTDVDFILDNLSKKKLFHFDVNKVTGVIYYNDSGWSAHTDVNALVKKFAFNTHNGSFIKGKKLQTDLELFFNKKNKILTIPAQEVTLNNDDVNFAAKFFLSDSVKTYKINLVVDAIAFKDARLMLSPNIQKKLLALDFEKDIQAKALIAGSLVKRGDPLVNVNWTIKDNIMNTPGGKITDCNMTGSFVNNYNPAFERNDRNSLIAVPKLTGSWNAIPFAADSVKVLDLIDPLISAQITSAFPLKKINQIVPSNIVSLSGGTAEVKVFYRGALKPDDPRPPFIKGFVKLKQLAATYLPRNLAFTNSTINLDFNGADLFLRNSKVQCKNAVLFIEGSLLNFLNLYYTDPSKIVLDFSAKSPFINLEEFQSLLGKRKTAANSKAVKGGKNLQKAAGQLDAILDKSNVHLNLGIDKLKYKKFLATGIKADARLTDANISLNNVSANNSGGSLLLNANIDQRGVNNSVTLNANIQNVDVQQFFAALENFGQDAITDNNIRGQLSAKAAVKTVISDAGNIIPGSMKGKVDFNLVNGALINFEPLKKINRFVFRNRDLANITFSDIKNTLDLLGDKITINPMHIESSAITFNVDGVYGLRQKGTDIRVDVPLRNPKRDKDIADDEERKERSMKGLVIHLQAVNGDDGNVKIKLRSKGKEDEYQQPSADSLSLKKSNEPAKKKKKGLFSR